MHLHVTLPRKVRDLGNGLLDMGTLLPDSGALYLVTEPAAPARLGSRVWARRLLEALT